MGHNKYFTSCHIVYYAYKLNSEKHPNMYLSIVHENMDKDKTSIPSLGEKEKSISSAMDIPIYLISMITRVHKIGGFCHFGISILEMVSNFNMISSVKCLKHIKYPMMDLYGIFQGNIKPPIT